MTCETILSSAGIYIDDETEEGGFMKAVKKICSMFVTLIMALSLVICVQASGQVCYIGEDTETLYTLNEAINTAQAGSTIHLIRDAEFNEKEGATNNRMTIGKALTIDGTNGDDKFTITFNAEAQIMGRSATVTFTNVNLDLNSKHFRTDNPGAKLVFGNGTIVTGGFAGANGGAVEVNNTSELVLESGSTIENCTATYNGGAIFVNGGTVTVNSGARINSCTATKGGGGAVQVQGAAGKLNLLGGEITGNTSNNGGGIYMYEGALIVSGDAVVTGNKKGETNNNIQLRNASQLTLTGTFTGSAGITIGSSDFGTADEGASGAENFYSDADETVNGYIKDGVLSMRKDGVCYVGESEETGTVYTSLDEAIRAANGSIIHLIKDASLGGESQITYSVPFSIDGAGEENYKITFIGNIQIMNTGGETKFTNAILDFQNKYSLRVAVTAKPTKLTFGEGAVAINGSRVNGGTVETFKNHDSALDVVLESGSVIKDSVATSNAGAIFINGGTITVNSGARIENCTASNGVGGAIHVQNQGAYLGSAVIKGGEIKNCHAKNSGGAVNISQGCTLTLSGNAVINENTRGDSRIKSNITVYDSNALILTGDFSGSVGVGFKGKGETFAKAESAFGAYNLTSDTDETLHGFAEGEKIVWVPGTVEVKLSTDSGIIVENDEIKEGIIRYVTSFNKTDSTIEEIGTYILPESIFAENEDEIYKSTGKSLESCFASVAAGSEIFDSAISEKSYCVDINGIPADCLDISFKAISFIKIGGVYVFVPFDATSVNEIKNGEGGAVKILDGRE